MEDTSRDLKEDAVSMEDSILDMLALHRSDGWLGEEWGHGAAASRAAPTAAGAAREETLWWAASVSSREVNDALRELGVDEVRIPLHCVVPEWALQVPPARADRSRPSDVFGDEEEVDTLPPPFMQAPDASVSLAAKPTSHRSSASSVTSSNASSRADARRAAVEDVSAGRAPTQHQLRSATRRRGAAPRSLDTRSQRAALALSSPITPAGEMPTATSAAACAACTAASSPAHLSERAPAGPLAPRVQPLFDATSIGVLPAAAATAIVRPAHFCGHHATITDAALLYSQPTPHLVWSSMGLSAEVMRRYERRQQALRRYRWKKSRRHLFDGARYKSRAKQTLAAARERIGGRFAPVRRTGSPSTQRRSLP
ncbi:hypothetical protein CDCA_CDCA12G3527 [Cyanidium caldarium]|uniref:CCT domain-containing protein n=1 Tax=Cyanidium caldarium TaxID=2771 RepID=A0AAV9IYY2_CYACA|nr:hypothetical protein CDCA_CDCA12G3527 [Cyanidium caldarium]